jgi:acyl-CoA thioesterase-1
MSFMSSVALHFASGAAFFSGAACLLIGIGTITFAKRRALHDLARILLLVGLACVVISATPLPEWAWCVWGIVFLAWVVTVAGTASAKRQKAAFAAIIGCTLATVLWELWYQLPPRQVPGHWSKLVVIGDSLSAEDFREGGDPWPTLIARDHGIEVVNLAFSGATAGFAEKKVASEEVAGALVVLEIGGNDILGSTTPPEFKQNLERLLQKVCRNDNAVVMLELPLPPLYNRYGEIQRRLARRHGVVLVPKRYFCGVLRGEQSVLDGLHLAPAGHRKMAEMIYGVLGASLTRKVGLSQQVPNRPAPAGAK